MTTTNLEGVRDWWLDLLHAALDQPRPTQALQMALRQLLAITNHPNRERRS